MNKNTFLLGTTLLTANGFGIPPFVENLVRSMVNHSPARGFYNKPKGLDFSGQTITADMLENKDLQYANFNGCTFYDVYLDHQNLTGSTFVGADLRKASLKGAWLLGSNLTNAQMTEIDTKGANFDFRLGVDSEMPEPFDWDNSIIEYGIIRTDLSGVEASKANFTGASLYCVTLTDANLEAASLVEADLTRSHFSSTNLREANLRSATLKYVKLKNTNLEYAKLTNTNISGDNKIIDQAVKYGFYMSVLGSGYWIYKSKDIKNLGSSLLYLLMQLIYLYTESSKKSVLEGSNLSNANLTGANLKNSVLRNVNMNGVNLTRANLQCIDSINTNLNKTILKDADMSSANLIAVELKDADLSDANLENAVLKNADMSGTNLTRAYIKGSDLRGTRLDGVTIGWGVIVPIGFTDQQLLALYHSKKNNRKAPFMATLRHILFSRGLISREEAYLDLNFPNLENLEN